MVRSFAKLFCLALVVSFVALGSEAKAGWWHHGCSGGSWGSSGGSCGGSSGGCSGIFHHHHLFHHSSGCWGSSGGCSGVSSCYSAAYTCGGSGGGFYSAACTGGYGCYGGASYYSNSSWGGTATWGTEHPVSGCADCVSSTSSTGSGNQTSGLVSVSVPADAKVWVNGKFTTSIGTDRQYISHGLEAGATYQYIVKVEVVRNGEAKSETKTVTLQAGATSSLAFKFAEADTKVATTEF
jgi:uncharacterized protein (TIGR03000 family)